MRERNDRWGLAEIVPGEIGGTTPKFLPIPRFESKAEGEDYLKQHAQDYAGREVFVAYREAVAKGKPRRRRSGRRQPRH